MENGQIISTVFTALFLLIAIFGLLKGLSRGFGRQTVRAVTIAISAILSLIVTSSITSTLAELCAGKTLDEVLVMYELHTGLEESVLNLLACFDAVTVERIIELPLLTVIMPFVFTGAFMVISLVLLFVHGIIVTIFRISGKHAGITSRLAGLLLGAAQGVAVAIIFFLPLINIINLTSLAKTTIEETQPEVAEENAICILYDEYIKDTKESPAFKFVEVMGADALCNSFATIEINGEDVNLRSTLSLMLSSADDFMEIAEYDLANPTEEQCKKLKSTIGTLVHDGYISNILSGAARGVAIAIDTGVLVIELEEPALGVMNNLMGIFTTLNEENFPTDIDTIIDVYTLLAKEGVLASLSGSTEEITNAFVAQDENGVTVIRRIINTIESNPHMKPLVTMLSKLSVSIMMNDVGIEQGEEVYDTIKDGIVGVIAIDKSQYSTDEEYVDAVAESLNETLKEHNIELAPEIVDGMADYLANQEYSNLSEDEINDDHVNDLILSYYESYMDYVNNGGENPFPGILPDNPEGGDVEGGASDSIPEGVEPEGDNSKV